MTTIDDLTDYLCSTLGISITPRSPSREHLITGEKAYANGNKQVADVALACYQYSTTAVPNMVQADFEIAPKESSPSIAEIINAIKEFYEAHCKGQIVKYEPENGTFCFQFPDEDPRIMTTIGISEVIDKTYLTVMDHYRQKAQQEA